MPTIMFQSKSLRFLKNAFEKACDDHFAKMQDTARNDHLKKKSLGFVCRNNFFAVDIAKYDSTAFNWIKLDYKQTTEYL